MLNLFKSNRRWFVPEVVQTSAMDCGPAALKCLLEGFSIPVSYGRLREACQTDVDGTSIDTMEEVAIQLGLAAEQIMVPVDHVFLSQANTLPALAVVCLPSGVTHFVVIWRCIGAFVQIMDPAAGRRWLTRQQLLAELYLHVMPVPAEGWREWAGTDEFLHPLRQRLVNLGLRAEEANADISGATADPGWRGLAGLDAATRMVTALVRADGLQRGQEAGRVVAHFFQQACEGVTLNREAIPQTYWSVWPMTPETPSATLADEEIGAEELSLRGAVLVRIRGKKTLSVEATGETAPVDQLSPELIAALAEPPSRPSWELLKLLRADGLFFPMLLASALLIAAGTVVIEALLLRSLLDLGRLLGTSLQRMTGIALTITFAFVLMLLEWAVTGAPLQMGRKLENRLRIAFLSKLPILGDRYFQSRLVSDMAERSHSLHKLRLLPDLGRHLLRITFEVILTTAGIIWLAPASAPLALLAALCALGLPMMANPSLMAQDLRVRTHLGALGRFYHDAMLGLAPIRTHGAEAAVRREQESLLTEWARASQGFVTTVVLVEALQMVLGFGLAAGLLFQHLAQGGDASGVLLLVDRTLNLPLLGQELVLAALQYPALRNTTLRMLEPLGARQEENIVGGDQEAAASNPPLEQTGRGVAIILQNVSVRAAGHTILRNVTLTLAQGSHLAIVGASGAGKSSLVALLLGWHRPATGQVWVDGQALTPDRLEQLRNETAWVDPSVQLWNRSLLDNLRYGGPTDPTTPIDAVINQADLLSVLEKMNDGLQTGLGEGGALVSGGEGQRVRLGRAMLRQDVRLVILDEPFRGLDREKRRLLLQRARRWWQDATLICITHDVSETQQFERVVVMEEGRIMEDGAPATLVAQPESRYGALLEAEEAVRTGLWSGAEWQRLWLEGGKLA